MTQVQIDYVDTHPMRQVVSTVVEHGNGQRYRLGHLPGEGWFCVCSRARRCPHIPTVQALIPRIPSASKEGGAQ